MEDLRAINPHLYDTLAYSFHKNPQREVEKQKRIKENLAINIQPPRPFPAERYDPDSKIYKPIDYYNQQQQEYNTYLENYIKNQISNQLGQNNSMVKSTAPKRKQGKGKTSEGKIKKPKKEQPTKKIGKGKQSSSSLYSSSSSATSKRKPSSSSSAKKSLNSKKKVKNE